MSSQNRLKSQLELDLGLYVPVQGTSPPYPELLLRVRVQSRKLLELLS